MTHPHRPSPRRPRRQQGIGPPVLVHRQGSQPAFCVAGVGNQDQRAPGERPAGRVPRSRRLQPPELPVHARIGRGLARAGDFAIAHCQIALGTQSAGSGPGSRIVPPESGTCGPRSNMAGVRMSWSSRSRAVCTRGKGSHSPTSSESCRLQNRIWRRRSSKTPTSSTS